MNSYTVSHTSTFTITHARHIAAKVATDLKRMQRFYGKPIDSWIADYESEVVELLKGGYLDTVTYGFKRGDQWIEPTLRYAAKDLAGADGLGDDPGRVLPGKNIDGASFSSYLTYTPAWDALASTQQEAIKRQLPFQRGGAPEPGINGYLVADRTYSAGGKALDRFSVRSY
jgi:hypothetical protein